MKSGGREKVVLNLRCVSAPKLEGRCNSFAVEIVLLVFRIIWKCLWLSSRAQRVIDGQIAGKKTVLKHFFATLTIEVMAQQLHKVESL